MSLVQRAPDNSKGGAGDSLLRVWNKLDGRQMLQATSESEQERSDCFQVPALNWGDFNVATFTVPRAKRPDGSVTLGNSEEKLPGVRICIRSLRPRYCYEPLIA